MSAKSIAKKAFKANAITEEEYKQLLCVIKLSDESLRQKGVWINAPTVEITEEQAIDKLHETGWLPLHDKEMTERPQGKWGKWEWVQYDANPNIGNWHCSECRYIPHGKKEYQKTNFCPNCGADMRGKEND